MKKIESLTVLNGIDVEIGVTRIGSTAWSADRYEVPIFINKIQWCRVNNNGGIVTESSRDHRLQLWEDPNAFWVPELGGEYFFINDTNEVHSVISSGHRSQQRRILSGNFYKTEKECEFARDKFYFVQKLRVWFHENKRVINYKYSFEYFRSRVHLIKVSGDVRLCGCFYKDCFNKFKNELEKYFK